MKTLSAQRQAGFRTAWFLWSDDRRRRGLYNVAGFKEVRRFCAAAERNLNSLALFPASPIRV